MLNDSIGQEIRCGDNVVITCKKSKNYDKTGIVCQVATDTSDPLNVRVVLDSRGFSWCSTYTQNKTVWLNNRSLWVKSHSKKL